MIIHCRQVDIDCTCLSGQLEAGAGANIDTQVTLPWVGEGSPFRPKEAGSPITVVELRTLQPQEVGYVLFDPLCNMTRGASALRDFFQVDFLDPSCDIVNKASVAYDTLVQVMEITKEVIQDAKDSIHALSQHDNAFVGMKDSATQAADNIKLMAELEKDPAKKQRKKDMAQAWLERELRNLNSRRGFLEDVASKRATTAGAKIQRFLRYLEEHGHFSVTFQDVLETWQELDATEILAARVARSGTLTMLAQSSKLELGSQGQDSQQDSLPDTLVETQAAAPVHESEKTAQQQQTPCEPQHSMGNVAEAKPMQQEQKSAVPEQKPTNRSRLLHPVYFSGIAMVVE